jgi:hypothetical protein
MESLVNLYVDQIAKKSDDGQKSQIKTQILEDYNSIVKMKSTGNTKPIEILISLYLKQLGVKNIDDIKQKILEQYLKMKAMVQARKKSAGKGATFDSVKLKAEEIAGWNNTADQLIWLLAEAGLKINLGRQPSDAEIRPMAEKIAKEGNTPEQLHWHLAEMKILNENSEI